MNKAHRINRVVFFFAGVISVYEHVTDRDILGMYAVYVASFALIFTGVQTLLEYERGWWR